MSTQPSKDLEVFDNPHPQRNYVITHHVSEFTCLCPLTGQPDFAKIKIEYIADKKCIELKSLKMYMWSFREEGGFHEAMTNRFLEDLVKAMNPRYLRVTGNWFVRGGINTDVMVEHVQDDWTPPPVQNII